MNKFTKTIQSTLLCIRYPFLKYFYCKDKLIQKSCWYFAVDKGWRYIALQMFREIRREMKRVKVPLSRFHIYDIKEKYGALDIDCNSFGDISKIVEKYEYISAHTCNICGRQAYGYTDGYILPYCADCGKDKNLIPYYTKDDKWYGYYKIQ